MMVRHICRIYSLALLITLLSGAALAAETNAGQTDAKEIGAVITKKENIRGEKKNKDDIICEVRYVMPKLNLTVNTGKTTAGQRETINFRDKLGIENSNVPELKLTWGKFDFDYIHVRQTGDIHLADSFVYQGVEFTDANLHSVLELDYIAVNWKQKIWEKNRVELYGGAGLRMYYMYTSVAATANPGINIKSSDVLFRVAPTLNLSVHAYLDEQKRLMFFSDFAGMTMGHYGYLYDYEAGVSYTAYRNFSIAGGYRVINMNADLSVNDDDRPMYRLRGPYFSIVYHF